MGGNHDSQTVGLLLGLPHYAFCRAFTFLTATKLRFQTFRIPPMLIALVSRSGVLGIADSLAISGLRAFMITATGFCL